MSDSHPDGPVNDQQPVDDDELLPFDDGPTPGLADEDDPFSPGAFSYIGQALTAADFADYVAAFNFGDNPPDYVVLHHTWKPCTQQAFLNKPNTTVWDSGEAGRSEAQIREKRHGLLDGIRDFYRDTKHWSIGPHLFIDDRYIWLFTPMSMVGAHALTNPTTGLEGNGYRVNGKLHRSIGIEVVGNYETVRWPEPVATLVGQSVAILRRRLGTFAIRHQPGAGGISSHRDYNKPECPGAAITEQFYLDVINSAAQRLQQATAGARQMEAARASIAGPGTAPSAQGYTEDSAILGQTSASPGQVLRHILSSPHGAYTEVDIRDSIVPSYFAVCAEVGVDPALAIAQMLFETDNLDGFWAARPQRNPAKIGVSGRRLPEQPADTQGWAQNEQQQRWEQGLSFASWKDESIPAHVGRLLAYALPVGGGDSRQRDLIARALQFRPLPEALRGSAPTIKRLGKAHNPAGAGWADPGEQYGAQIAAIAQQFVGG